MDILSRIREDVKMAMKSGDAALRDVLRMAESAIRNKEIELRASGKELSQEDAEAVIAGEVKKRRESAKQYRDGGREELAVKEEEEIAVLEKYLPEKVSDEDLDRVVSDAVAKTGASGPADMGKVMGAAMAEAKKLGSVDGNAVREKVQKALASL